MRFGSKLMQKWKQQFEADMINTELDNTNGQSLFFKALVIVFLIRLFLSAWIPLTSDEAYFVIWGNNLDYGFYDHPPFVGWLLGG